VKKPMDSGLMPCIRRNGRRYILPSEVGKWLRSESRFVAPRPDRRGSAPRMKMEDVDPALREFFERALVQVLLGENEIWPGQPWQLAPFG
jgi:hypothetical protein